jgi:hypothetical protein
MAPCSDRTDVERTDSTWDHPGDPREIPSPHLKPTILPLADMCLDIELRATWTSGRRAVYAEHFLSIQSMLKGITIPLSWFMPSVNAPVVELASECGAGSDCGIASAVRLQVIRV